MKIICNTPLGYYSVCLTCRKYTQMRMRRMTKSVFLFIRSFYKQWSHGERCSSVGECSGGVYLFFGDGDHHTFHDLGCRGCIHIYLGRLHFGNGFDILVCHSECRSPHCGFVAVECKNVGREVYGRMLGCLFVTEMPRILYSHKLLSPPITQCP